MKKRFSLSGVLLASLLAAPLCGGCVTNKTQTEPVQTVLNAKIAEGQVPCGVFVYTDPVQSIVTAKSGWADAGKTIPADENSVFWVASMTKGVTGIAFMILVDEGKVSPDDPVCKVLPEFAAKPNLRMRHLLTHVHGLTFPHIARGSMSLKEFSEKTAAAPLRWEPGSNYEYGRGPAIAGRVIEVLSGMPYETFLKTRVFDPLEMKDTTFTPSVEQRKRLVPLVRWNEKKKQFLPEPPPVDFTKKLYPAPDGGLFSTAADYVKLVRMLLCKGVTPDGRRILSEKSCGELGKNQVLEIEGRRYGYGFGGNEDCFWHAGAGGTTWWIRPATHRGYVWMTNVIGMYGGIAVTREACAQAAEIYDPQDELNAWKVKYNVK